MLKMAACSVKKQRLGSHSFIATSIGKAFFYAKLVTILFGFIIKVFIKTLFDKVLSVFAKILFIICFYY